MHHYRIDLRLHALYDLIIEISKKKTRFLGEHIEE